MDGGAKSSKIFKDLKFYLDIEEKQECADVEAIIARHDGKILKSLCKTVTHVVFHGGTAKHLAKAQQENKPVVHSDWIREYTML